jgi:hypothetical protein
MSKDYVFLCGVMWTQYASEDAGQELVRALRSEDPEVVSLACALLEATPAAPRLSSPVKLRKRRGFAAVATQFG